MKEKREHQQEKLLRAACDLVAETGVAALRTRDIAGKTGVSVGTLHYCFATKQDLLKALYQFILAEFRRMTETLELDYESARETLEGQARIRVHLLRSQDTVYRAWRAFTREGWTDPLVLEIVRNHFDEQRQRFERILARGRADGSLPPSSDVPDAMTAAMLVSLFEGLTLQWRLDQDSVDPHAYVQAMYGLLGLKPNDQGTR